MFESFDSLRILSKQIVGLMDELSIDSAHVYGCSSGGATVLGMVADYPTRVLSGIVHEVPLAQIEQVEALTKLSDPEIVSTCREMWSTFLCEDKAAWEALGSEYHARLDKNYVTWVRQYVSKRGKISFTEKELKQRPIIWTIGALSPAGLFFENVKAAVKADIPISLLPCKHYPQVSIPEKLAEHIKESALRVEK
jgi:pimeloyl-ACP methyl ester carboxylesterase